MNKSTREQSDVNTQESRESKPNNATHDQVDASGGNVAVVAPELRPLSLRSG